MRKWASGDLRATADHCRNAPSVSRRILHLNREACHASPHSHTPTVDRRKRVITGIMTAAVFGGWQQLGYERPIEFFTGVSPGALIARILAGAHKLVGRRNLPAILSLPRPSSFDRPGHGVAWTQAYPLARGCLCAIRIGYAQAITDLRFARLVSAEQRISGFLAGDRRQPS